MDFFDILGQMAQAECPSCGAATSSYSHSCENCGASLGESEDPSLNLRDSSAGSRAGLDKTEMHESKNLKKLKQAVADLRAGGAVEVYLAAVDEVAVMVESALELYTSPYMQERIANMEPGPAQIYKEMAKAAQELSSSLDHMENPDQAEAGLKRFEAGLWKVDAIQDRTIAKATQLADAGEA
ncbi:hypothetical protein ABS71_14505 [bacterium SCN 62-11]|nr:hypothetical protein [Candidatus Eremiobacteraeota bacterium]ODT63284.1 MAG: hypothetical protein ABS71_14505 [bacterium SCN 62-11]